MDLGLCMWQQGQRVGMGFQGDSYFFRAIGWPLSSTIYGCRSIREVLARKIPYSSRVVGQPRSREVLFAKARPLWTSSQLQGQRGLLLTKRTSLDLGQQEDHLVFGRDFCVHFMALGPQSVVWARMEPPMQLESHRVAKCT